MTELKNQAEKKSLASRWSRRKQQVKIEQEMLDISADELRDESTPTATTASDTSSAEQLRAENLAQLNALKDEDMPDIASLNEDSDFSQFMSINVSEKLRKLALRKLFQGESYNVRDGLDEYDGDYTSFERLDPRIITADMKYRQQLEAEKLKSQLEEEGSEEVEVLADDDPGEQQAADATEEEPQMIENEKLTDSDEELRQNDNQDSTQTALEQSEHAPAIETTTDTSGEKQT
jgi:transcription initiation factor IIE alpha subunit